VKKGNDMNIRVSIDAVDRIELGPLPTPMEHLSRLSKHLGVEIWMKRDDLTGFALGGNKVRKLEFLLPEALAKGADTIVTVGALQSNHARQTAAAAARLGLKCVLLLGEAVQGRSEAYQNGGNLALDRMVGAEVRRVPGYPIPAELIAKTLEELENSGHKPVFIPTGGSTVTGALGYAVAAAEIEQQAKEAGIKPSLIINGSGSGGTQAGLVLGTSIPVLGISVAPDEATLRQSVGKLVEEGLKLPQFRDVGPRQVNVDDRFVGPGYGLPTPEMSEAVQLVAQLEGIFLDPVYTGKAMAGLIHLARSGKLTGPVVFVHTGGQPAIFVYDDVF
jgi:D-cysteine desulfhydrase family pyridoxal phosphate-dependent enzyme